MTTSNILRAFVLSTSIALGTSLAAAAQDNNTDNHQITVSIPNVALLDLETGGTRNFTASFVQPTPLEAGQKLSAPGIVH